MQQITIQTVGDLAREVRSLLDSPQKWLFRGQPDTRWDLLPSVHRGYSRQQERYLTNEFRVRARSRYSRCPDNDDYSGWLALMQHYGLPTRLLDWTYSPLVAAFFAVHPDYAPPQADPQRDACIWALSAGELNESQGFEPLIFPLDAASYQPLIAPAFKNREEPETIGVAMAIEHDPRIQLQQGAFTVHSCRTPLNCLPACARALCRLVIPAAAVVAFCEELSLLGMRKSNLFPDLASLTSELRAMHPPAGGGQQQQRRRILDFAAPIRRAHSMTEDAMTATHEDRHAQRETLENSNLTQAASPQEGVSAGEGEGRPEPDEGLENQNLTRPNPPPAERSEGKTA
jgi:hypothetical protein